MARLIQQNPGIRDIRNQIEEHTQRYVARQQLTASRSENLITIPVVVHIVYQNAQENLSMAQIQSQIDILNEDFRRLNSDTTSVWPQGDDTEIEFCLAKIDPNGVPTNGVTRTQTSRSSFSNDDIKFTASDGRDAWPRDQYMNMWVGDIGNGLLGYATLPGGPANVDGVVVNYRYFGGPQFASPPFNYGRTTTHEVGHWLNLFHTWGNGSGCNGDDNVADTPNSEGPNFGCATGVVTCNSTDMVENYMDYSDDACMNLFTNGQKLRMRAIFSPGGSREALLSSNVCCGETATCTSHSNWTVLPLSDSSAELRINAFTSGDSLNIRYAPTGTSNWTTISVFSDTTLFVSGLNACTEYTFGVQTICDSTNEFTSFSCNQTQVATIGCCESPSIDTTFMIGDSSFLNWAPVYGALQYQLRYREVGSTLWNDLAITDTSYWINELKGCTSYEYQTRTFCNIRGNVLGEYGAVQSFDTPFSLDLDGCTQCQNTAYCTPGAISSQDAHINNVQFGDIFQTFTGQSVGGYGDFTGTTYNFPVDSTYTLSLASGNQANLAWKVWIDLNKDGHFSDTTELIVDEEFPTPTILQSFAIPDDYPLGITRMRVAARLVLTNDSWDDCVMNGFGEYEDYCINFIPKCVGIEEVSVRIDSTTEEVVLEWPGNPNASYEYGYILEGDTAWTSFEVDSNYVVISPDSLFGCSVYNFRVKLNCEGPNETSSFTLTDSVKTICGVGVEALRAEDIRLYPNPAKDQFWVESPALIRQVSLVNVVGKEVLTQQEGSERVSIQLGEVPEGVYFLKIKTAKQEIWKRVLVKR